MSSLKRFATLYPGQVRSIGRISRIRTRTGFRNIFPSRRRERERERERDRYRERGAHSPAATNSVTHTCTALQLLPPVSKCVFYLDRIHALLPSRLFPRSDFSLSYSTSKNCSRNFGNKSSSPGTTREAVRVVSH